MVVADVAQRRSDLRAVRNAGLMILVIGACGVLVLARSRPARGAAHVAAAERPAAVVPSTPGVVGFATFYGVGFDGLTMADGGVFAMDDPTIAAANAWPLGTRLQVRRVPGGPWDSTLTPAERAQFFGRTITVTVHDHGAFSHAIDLSRGAFALLGRPEEGVIRVEIDVLDGGAGTAAGGR